jgi:hypothetical protein
MELWPGQNGAALCYVGVPSCQMVRVFRHEGLVNVCDGGKGSCSDNSLEN